MNATIRKDHKMIQSCLPREGRFYEVHNRVTLRSEALRRAAGTSATPTKAAIIRIKKNKGRHLTKTVPYGPTKRPTAATLELRRRGSDETLQL